MDELAGDSDFGLSSLPKQESGISKKSSFVLKDLNINREKIKEKFILQLKSMKFTNTNSLSPNSIRRKNPLNARIESSSVDNPNTLTIDDNSKQLGSDKSVAPKDLELKCNKTSIIKNSNGNISHKTSSV